MHAIPQKLSQKIIFYYSCMMNPRKERKLSKIINFIGENMVKRYCIKSIKIIVSEVNLTTISQHINPIYRKLFIEMQ